MCLAKTFAPAGRKKLKRRIPRVPRRQAPPRRRFTRGYSPKPLSRTYRAVAQSIKIENMVNVAPSWFELFLHLVPVCLRDAALGLQLLQILDHRPAFFFSQVIAVDVAGVAPARFAGVVYFSELDWEEFLARRGSQLGYLPAHFLLVVIGFIRLETSGEQLGTGFRIQDVVERRDATVVQIRRGG